jgi:hypothetical protein
MIEPKNPGAPPEPCRRLGGCFPGGQSGFGLLESLMGLVVFLILSMVGTKAFHNVVANHKESAQLKALTDAVSQTAEKLSGLSTATLSAAASGYTNWSAPQAVALGEYVYRFRVVPKPNIAGVADTVVVGLEVETGTMDKNTFTPVRSFATLIAPHVSSKNALGQVSTAKERQDEATFYASLRQSLADLSKSVVPQNQEKLNSFSCYDKGQCCGFMKKYFVDPTIHPSDGVDEKCLYRCALGGNVHIPEWNKACNTDFCKLASWKTKAQCCAAIASGDCKPGSICANVCIDCVGEDGSTCNMTMMTCPDYHFQNYVDCAKGTYCNGAPLTDDIVPGWGDVLAMCKKPECAEGTGDCSLRVANCCDEYWQFKEWGEPIDPRSEICATISTKEECCQWKVDIGFFVFDCNNDGTIHAAQYHGNNNWYCGNFPPDWNRYCAINKGCPSTYHPSGAPTGTCGSWSGPGLADPWKDPYTGKDFPGATYTGGTTSSTGSSQTSTGSPGRNGPSRGGSTVGSGGGQE